MFGNNLYNPKIIAKNSTVYAGNWNASENLTSLIDDKNQNVDISNIHFINKTAFGSFSDNISNNVIEYILSGDVTQPGEYKIIYMWGQLQRTNLTRNQFLTTLHLSANGSLGDKTWAIGYIKVLPAFRDNKIHAKNKKGILPETGVVDRSKNHSLRMSMMSLVFAVLMLMGIRKDKNKNLD
ncbi:hypothetical protein [Fructobacillus cardui]|uniref:hypothetical protein n=1 Tax=Fructobacillus cardui TaxID=2893170 RepID=UPI0030C80EC2